MLEKTQSTEIENIYNRNKNKYILEKVSKNIFFISSLIAVLSLLLIIGFVFYKGLTPFIFKGYSFIDFFTGSDWLPGSDKFGIATMVVASIVATVGALIIGVPIGILTAVFMAYYCPERIYKPLKAATELLAGIPSVIYGFFGLVVIVPLVREFGRTMGFHGNGNSILTASILLGMMILPTIIGLTESSLRAVPEQYYEGAVALGATHERSIFRVVIPAAKSGVIAALVLGIGRAIGETMAVIMVAGNQARMPEGIFRGVRTLTANIVIEMGYAAGLHREALIATGVVLFVFILILNFSVALLKRRSEHE